MKKYWQALWEMWSFWETLHNGFVYSSHLWFYRKRGHGEKRRRWRSAKAFWDAQTSHPSLLTVSPFLSQETPSGFERKLDLSSLVCMLCWDVPGMPHYPAHYTPLLFPNINTLSPLSLSVSLFLPFFSSVSHSQFLSLFLHISLSLFLPLKLPPCPQRDPQSTIRGPVM